MLKRFSLALGLSVAGAIYAFVGSLFGVSGFDPYGSEQFSFFAKAGCNSKACQGSGCAALAGYNCTVSAGVCNESVCC